MQADHAIAESQRLQELDPDFSGKSHIDGLSAWVGQDRLETSLKPKP